MSATLTDAVYRHSRATGRARAVLLAMAHVASHETLTRYGEALAWPSHATLAAMCRCSPKTVERAIPELVELGELRPTGDTKGRGALVYEIVIPAEGSTDTVVGGQVSTTDNGVGAMSSRFDTTDSVVGATSRVGDSSDNLSATTDTSAPTTDTVVGAAPTPLSDEPEGRGKLEPEPEPARADARGRSSPPDDWLAFARQQLGDDGSGLTVKERNHRRVEDAEDARERETIHP